jgi:hypothetical protein
MFSELIAQRGISSHSFFKAGHCIVARLYFENCQLLVVRQKSQLNSLVGLFVPSNISSVVSGHAAAPPRFRSSKPLYVSITISATIRLPGNT